MRFTDNGIPTMRDGTEQGADIVLARSAGTDIEWYVIVKT
jgi:hypothetical protein